MSGLEFDVEVTGKTVYYSQNGQTFGVEQYLPNQRVIWSFDDGRCQYGHWFDRGDLICFEYEDQPGTQCWLFERGPTGLVAYFNGDKTDTPLVQMPAGQKPMLCYGPDVGV